MTTSWLIGAHNKMEGYDVHSSTFFMSEGFTQKVRIFATHPNQKNAAA